MAGSRVGREARTSVNISLSVQTEVACWNYTASNGLVLLLRPGGSVTDRPETP